MEHYVPMMRGIMLFSRRRRKLQADPADCFRSEIIRFLSDLFHAYIPILCAFYYSEKRRRLQVESS